MVAYSKPAPRVVGERTNMAAASAAIVAEADRAAQGIMALNEWSLGGTRPFNTTPAELQKTAGEEAHALTVVLAMAVNEVTVGYGPDDMPYRKRHIAKALDAIGTLIALSMMAGEASAAA